MHPTALVQTRRAEASRAFSRVGLQRHGGKLVSLLFALEETLRQEGPLAGLNAHDFFGLPHGEIEYMLSGFAAECLSTPVVSLLSSRGMRPPEGTLLCLRNNLGKPPSIP